jgi:hypothetical protein
MLKLRYCPWLPFGPFKGQISQSWLDLYLDFFIFDDLAFYYETAYDQILPFYFLGPGNPDTAVTRSLVPTTL